MANRKNQKCKVFEGESIFELEDKLNLFFNTQDVYASPIFPPISKKDTWKAMAYYEERPLDIKNEKEVKKEEPTKPMPEEKDPNAISDAQIKLLKTLKYTGNLQLSKIQAHEKIQELLKK